MHAAGALSVSGCNKSGHQTPPPVGFAEAEFERMFRQYRGELLSFLTRTLRNRDDAEDSLVQTFVKAWNNRDRFRGETTEKNWLYRIAQRVAIDSIRARQARPTESLELLGDQVRQDNLEPDPADIVSTSERRSEIREKLACLPADQRQLVELYYFDTLRYDEISVLLGIPVSQVKGRLHRIRRVLQREFALEL